MLLSLPAATPRCQGHRPRDARHPARRPARRTDQGTSSRPHSQTHDHRQSLNRGWVKPTAWSRLASVGCTHPTTADGSCGRILTRPAKSRRCPWGGRQAVGRIPIPRNMGSLPACGPNAEGRLYRASGFAEWNRGMDRRGTAGRGGSRPRRSRRREDSDEAQGSEGAEDADASGPAGDRGPGRASAPERRRLARAAARAGGGHAGRRPVGQGAGVPLRHDQRRDRHDQDRGRGQPGRHVGRLRRESAPRLRRDQRLLEDRRARSRAAAGMPSLASIHNIQLIDAGQPDSLSGVGGTPLASVLMSPFNLVPGGTINLTPGVTSRRAQLDRPEHERPAPQPAAGPVVPHPAGERRQHRGRRRAGSSASWPRPAAASRTSTAPRRPPRARRRSRSTAGSAGGVPAGGPEPHRDDRRHHDRPDRHRQLVAGQLRLDGGVLDARGRPDRRRSPPRRASRSPTPATAAGTRCSPTSRAASPPSRTSSSRWPPARRRPSPPRRRASSSRPTPSAGRPPRTSTR